MFIFLLSYYHEIFYEWDKDNIYAKRHVRVTCHQCIFSSHNSHEVGGTFSILHMKKLKFKRAKTCPKFAHCWSYPFAVMILVGKLQQFNTSLWKCQDRILQLLNNKCYYPCIQTHDKFNFLNFQNKPSFFLILFFINKRVRLVLNPAVQVKITVNILAFILLNFCM